MDDPVDLLQIKIEEARRNLPPETIRAIDAVPWKATLLGMRESKGYSFEQLGDLEIETELLLCGLVTPEEYPKQLEARMLLPKAKVEELVNDMNQLVFSRIREEMIKNAEKEKIFKSQTLPELKKETNAKPTPGINKDELGVLDKAGIKIIDPNLTAPEIKAPATASKPVEGGLSVGQPSPQSASAIPPILTQKFAGAFKLPTVTTEHEGEIAQKKEAPAPKVYPKGADPYRLPPEE